MVVWAKKQRDKVRDVTRECFKHGTKFWWTRASIRACEYSWYIYVNKWKVYGFVCGGNRMSDFMSDGRKCEYMRPKAFIHPWVFYVVVIHDVCEVMCSVYMENRTAICEFFQDWFDFLLVFKSQIPQINVMKNILQGKIDQFFSLVCTIIHPQASTGLQCGQVVLQ